jgi:23S rRNA pseudouridine955/2504/2580 synthase
LALDQKCSGEEGAEAPRLYQPYLSLGNSSTQNMTLPVTLTESTRTSVRNTTIAAENAGRRLDNFLSAQLKSVPKSWVYRLIRTGQVRVNGKRAQAATRLAAGDLVRIPPITLDAAPSAALPPQAVTTFENMVCYEDGAVIVVNKPAGLASHAGTGIRYGLIELARAARPRASRIDLVHRLDRATSGCLLLAKDPVTLRNLNEQLAQRGFGKEYQALLSGAFARSPVIVDAPLEVNKRDMPERRTAVEAAGVEARSTFMRVEQFHRCCLVNVVIDTGRTHQIRVHAAHLGCAVAGDPKYGDDAFNTYMKSLGLRRMFLHAHRIEFALERTITVEAPLPNDLAAVLERLAAHE